MPQGRSSGVDGTRRFDDLVPSGWQLILRADPALEDACRLHESGAIDAVVAIDADSDVDKVYLPWLAQHDAIAVLVRPDGYVFGPQPTSSKRLDSSPVGRRSAPPTPPEPEEH